jgi:hypothetical protein
LGCSLGGQTFRDSRMNDFKAQLILEGIEVVVDVEERVSLT